VGKVFGVPWEVESSLPYYLFVYGEGGYCVKFAPFGVLNCPLNELKLGFTTLYRWPSWLKVNIWVNIYQKNSPLCWGLFYGFQVKGKGEEL
jgi:hypothetical protein